MSQNPIRCCARAVRRLPRLPAPAVLAAATLLLIGGLLIVASASHATSAYRIDVTTRPSPPPIGGLTPVVVRVTDPATDAPVSGADVRVMAHMPAMPMGEIFKQAAEDPKRPGLYTLPWVFPMAGDWAIDAQVTGPNGHAKATLPVAVGSFSLPAWIWWIGGGALALMLVALIRFVASTHGRQASRAALGRRQNVIAVLALAVVAAGVIGIVRYEKRGQIDWNAMSMDMADLRSDPAVDVARVTRGSIASKVTYSGTVVPYLEQMVYPRVEGYLQDFTIYPGTRVTQGEVLAHLQAPELASKAQEAQAGETAATRDVMIAQSERAQQAAETLATAWDVRAAKGAVTEGTADLAAARHAVQEAQAEAAAARAAVREAQQALVSAQADSQKWAAEIAREKRLYQAGAVSLEEYQSEQAQATAAQAAMDSARGKVDEARSNLQMSRAKLAAARSGVQAALAKIGQLQDAIAAAQSKRAAAQAALATATHNILHQRAMVFQAAAAAHTAGIYQDFRLVRATTFGVVTDRLVSPGVLVNPQTAIVKISRLDRVRLQANVAEQDLASIHVGTPVTITAPFLDRTIRARVTAVFPAASSETRTGIAEALVDNRDGKFTQGDYVTMTFYTKERMNVLLVPSQAVVQVQQGTGAPRHAVWTVVRNGQQTNAHQNFVLLGLSDGRRQEIRSGLHAGDQVIVRGQGLLTEGSPVQLPGAAPQMAMAPAVPSSSGGMARKVGGLTISLTTDPSPAKSGSVTLHLSVQDAMGMGVSGAKVHLDTSMPTMSMGGPSADARDEGGGRYSATVNMAMSAPWRVQARVQAPGKPAVAAAFDFPVQ